MNHYGDVRDIRILAGGGSEVPERLPKKFSVEGLVAGNLDEATTSKGRKASVTKRGFIESRESTLVECPLEILNVQCQLNKNGEVRPQGSN